LLANGHHVAVSSASVGLAAIEIVCDVPRNMVLMIPLSLSHYSLEGEDRGKDKKVVEMASMDIWRR